MSDFKKRIERREAPACPPTEDTKGYGYNARQPVMLGQKTVYPAVPAPCCGVAVTRWTNLYFPAPYGLFGDIVGGPVMPVMGAGVLDLPVTVGTWKGWLAHSWLSHTRYWSERGGAQGYLGTLTQDEHAITHGPRPRPPKHCAGRSTSRGCGAFVQWVPRKPWRPPAPKKHDRPHALRGNAAPDAPRPKLAHALSLAQGDAERRWMHAHADRGNDHATAA